jgi:predicted HicB family RNase H-like nuclease
MSQGETAEEAVAMIREAMELWAETALEMGKEVPAPFAEERYSGKFVVRLPRSLHRRLAERARQEGVSLNALVVSFVSEGLGGKSLGSEPSLRLEPPAGLWRAEDLPHTAVAAGRGPSYVA